MASPCLVNNGRSIWLFFFLFRLPVTFAWRRTCTSPKWLNSTESSTKVRSVTLSLFRQCTRAWLVQVCNCLNRVVSQLLSHCLSALLFESYLNVFLGFRRVREVRTWCFLFFHGTFPHTASHFLLPLGGAKSSAWLLFLALAVLLTTAHALWVTWPAWEDQREKITGVRQLAVEAEEEPLL